MKVYIDDGYTSVNLARVIITEMVNLNVPDDFVMTTKHFLVKNKILAERLKERFIYLAYDSECVVDNGEVWEEVKFLKKNEPEVIITVSKNAYDFYKSQGFNTHYCKIGYDDLNFKREDVERDNALSCAWTMDEHRHSTFYHRLFISKDITGFFDRNQHKFHISNQIPYSGLSKLYNRSILGLNDIILHTNQRCFEIPVCGAVMLVNEQIRNTDCPLKENRHYYVYESSMNLLGLVEKCLNEKEKTIKMGERARKEALKYPQSKYVKQMVDKLGLA